MAKVQNWVGLAQLRLDAAKTDLKGLRKELISRSNEIATRDHEISELRVKLAESEVAKNAYEKALTENVQRVGGPIPSPSTMTFVPSRQPMPPGAASTHSANIAVDSQHLPGTTAASLQTSPVDGAGVSTHSGLASTHPIAAGMISSPGNVPGGPSTYPDAAGAASLRSAATAAASLHPIGADAPLPSQGEAAGGPGVTASAVIIHNQQQTAGGLQATPDELSRDRQAGATVGPSGIAGAQLASYPAGSQPPGTMMRSLVRDGEGPATADAAVQSTKGKEKGKRESELESELARLRKENEKIVKERADYENAIQRALLRGVSSLNVETLRVLRCPPVSCYTPCGPPPSPVNTVEALIPCPPKKMRDNWTPAGCRTTSGPPKRASNRAGTNATLPEPEHGCCGKRPNTNSCRLSPRQKKSPGTSSPSMVFLLPQNEPARICVPTNTTQNRTCGRIKSRKLESSVCMRKVG